MKGGAEIDIAVLFADVRGSTALGEREKPSDFAALMNCYYRTATETLIAHDAIIDKLIGDEVMALFMCRESSTTVRVLELSSDSAAP